MDIGFYRVSSLIFCVISAITLISLLRRPTNTLVIALYPLAALSVIASSFASPAIVLHNTISAGMFSHILISILAYSLLTIATIQAITLALQERHLKHRHMGGILKALPPLQTMEQILFELLWLGIVFLTLSLVTGFIFIEDIFAQHLAHKTFFSFVAWGLFATLLWGRHQLGWRSQTAARWTIGGFIALMLAYYGSKFVLELVLT
nr:cytochrome c biogenesis protein CcsA [Oceanicoccus sp. KOV_DT_Chl]